MEETQLRQYLMSSAVMPHGYISAFRWSFLRVIIKCAIFISEIFLYNCDALLEHTPSSFDRDLANTAFLRKYRATIHGLTDTDDLLDREAAYHAAVLTPLVFLHQYRDSWCLLERVRTLIIVTLRDSLRVFANYIYVRGC